MNRQEKNKKIRIIQSILVFLLICFTVSACTSKKESNTKNPLPAETSGNTSKDAKANTIDMSNIELQINKEMETEGKTNIWPKTLVVSAKPEFDMALLENKEGLEVLNTLEFDILYIQILVQQGTDLQWLAKHEMVLGIEEDVERSIYSE